jgi:hypothetical protein
MATYYWYGGSGNWSDYTNHWSTNSGDSPHSAAPNAPTSSDNVIFNSASHTTSYTVTVDSAGSCADIAFSNPSSGNPTLALSANLSVYGSLTFCSGMSVTRVSTQRIYFNSTSTGKTITTAGVSGDIWYYFNGIGGEWTLQDNLTTTYDFEIVKGTVNTNSKTVTCYTFWAQNTNTRGLTIDNSIINVNGGWYNAGANETFSATGSKINLLGATVGAFIGGTRTYYDLEISGTNSSFEVSFSNTFHELKISGPAKTINFQDASTQTVTSFVATGSPTQVYTLTGSSTGGWTISDTTGTNTVSYCKIQYSTVSGGATWVANKSTDLGSNSGWTFNYPPLEAGNMTTVF